MIVRKDKAMAVFPKKKKSVRVVCLQITVGGHKRKEEERNET